MKKSSRTCILFVYVRGFAACSGKNTQMDQATLHGFYSQSQAPHRFKNQQRNKDVDLEKTQNATTPWCDFRGSRFICFGQRMHRCTEYWRCFRRHIYPHQIVNNLAQCAQRSNGIFPVDAYKQEKRWHSHSAKPIQIWSHKLKRSSSARARNIWTFT